MYYYLTQDPKVEQALIDQQSVVDASITQDHQLQFFTSTLNAPEGVTWKGNFADEMDIGSGELVTVDDLDMSTVGGAQLAISVV
ncbi:hypothetical protein OFO93_28470, partial [Escherichia coli]|nr:hypothetical protein [Escherichia coli]